MVGIRLYTIERLLVARSNYGNFRSGGNKNILEGAQVSKTARLTLNASYAIATFLHPFLKTPSRTRIVSHARRLRYAEIIKRTYIESVLE